jgi:hypothetical protein
MRGIDGTGSLRTGATRWWLRACLAATGTILLGGTMLGVASQPAYAASVTCGGMTKAAAQAAGFTIYDNAFSSTAVIVVGTPGPDWMVGGAGNDTLDGQGGNDLLCGRGGNDDLRGLSGNDQMFGGGGTDTGNGGAGANTCDANIETKISC